MTWRIRRAADSTRIPVWKRRSLSKFTNRVPVEDEQGAVLLLALLFMVLAATLIAGLASWSTNDIKNAGNLKSSRIAMYAAGSAIQVAAWNQRYTIPTATSAQMCPNQPPSGTGTSTDPFTLPDNPASTVLSQSVYVWCGPLSTSLTASNGWTRQLTMYAYPVGSPACTPTGAPTSCDTSKAPLIKAQVSFNDFDPSFNETCIPGKSGSTCGYGMTFDSWVVAPAS
jgi:hypothetical protein